MQHDWQVLINKTLRDESLLKTYVWEPFARGSSNSIFLGRSTESDDADQQTVVLRINAPAKDTPGVSRARESAILGLIQPYRWAPHIIRNEPKQGWCLMRYYDNAVTTNDDLSKSLKPQHQNKLLDALNELQAVETTADNLLIDYEALLDDTYVPLANAKNDSQAHQWILSVKESLTTLPTVPSCLVHHDLHLGNLVVPNTNNLDSTLTILDWEYAAIGNPWFDASCLSRYLSMPTHKIYELKHFSSLDSATFDSALKRANEMTETLQNLWYRARE